jgi:nucleoid-associated protein YgaU
MSITYDAPPGYGVFSREKQNPMMAARRFRRKEKSFFSSGIMSLLMGGASKIAIMGALSTTGAPAVAVAIAAGVGAGMVTTYYSNRHQIREVVSREQTFWGRMKARWGGFRQSYSGRQFAMNVAASSVGVVGGGLIFEAIAENVPVPKLAHDFMTAAQSNISNAIEWAGQQAHHASAVIEETIEAAQAYAATSPDLTEASDINYDEPRRVATLSIPPPSREPLSEIIAPRIAQTFAAVREAASVADLPSAGEPEMPVIMAAADPVAPETGPFSADTGNSAPGPAVPVDPALADPPPTLVIDSQHTVQRGDRLWDIAEKLGGVPSGDAAAHHEFIRKIVAANAEKYPELLANPNSLKIGWTLDIPDMAQTTMEADCQIVRGRYRGGCSLDIL